MPMRLTLRQFTYFVAIVDAGSMSRAAARLNVAPTALSLQMKAMEEVLGVTLFERHSRGVHLTETGQELALRARQILDLVAETRALVVRRPEQPPPRVRLGVPPAIARLLGVEAVLGAGSALNGTVLVIVEAWSSDLMKRLAEGEIDFMLGYGLTDSEDIAVIDLLEESFVFAASPVVAGGKGPITLVEVLATDMVFYGEKSVGLRALQTALEQARLPFPDVREVSSINVWRGFLCRGLGTAVTPFGAVAEEYERGEVVVRDISDWPLRNRLSLAVQRNSLASPSTRGFMEFIMELALAKHVGDRSRYRTLIDAPPRPTL